MPVPNRPTTNRLLTARNILFSAVTLGSFAGLLVYGAPRLSGEQVEDTGAGRLYTDQPLLVRQATPLPTRCDAAEVVDGVQGQLVRNGTARIIGISNIEELGRDPAGGRTCRALVNLAFGTQRVGYSFGRLAPASKIWQLEVTAR